MITYKCSAACKFCYYNCSPSQNALMPVDTAIKSWQGLKSLAGSSAKIHITGGEPFLFFDQMAQILEQAAKLNLGPVDQIETNASWAQNENDIIEKLKFLDANGMNILKISCDPFHSEFIETGKIKNLVNIATRILGSQRVLVRWQEYLDNPIPMKQLTENQRIQIYRENYQKYPFRFTSRAANTLGPIFANKTAEQIAQQNCKNTFMNAKGIHIDPYGNIFSGVCSGITVNNINNADLKDIWKGIDWQKMDFFSTVFNQGPAGLLPEAIKNGYKKRNLYASKCHLCSDLRQFFFDFGRYKSIIIPRQCYSDI